MNAFAKPSTDAAVLDQRTARAEWRIGRCGVVHVA